MRRGWTFIELLVAIGLMTLVASVVAAVYHAVIGGLAQSSDRTARYHHLSAIVERIVSDIESGPCDEDAERMNGIPLRIESRPTLRRTTSEALWFLTLAHGTDTHAGPAPAQARYRIQPSGPDRVALQLVREAWIIDDTLPHPLPEDQAIRDIVLPALADFQVDAWTTNGWTDQWPPPNQTNAWQAPDIVRVVVTLNDSRARPLAVTGTARRVIAGIPVTGTAENRTEN